MVNCITAFLKWSFESAFPIFSRKCCSHKCACFQLTERWRSASDRLPHPPDSCSRGPPALYWAGCNTRPLPGSKSTYLLSISPHLFLSGTDGSISPCATSTVSIFLVVIIIIIGVIILLLSSSIVFLLINNNNNNDNVTTNNVIQYIDVQYYMLYSI